MSEAGQGIFSLGESLPEREMEERMIGLIDAFLGHPPRQSLPAGSILFEEDVELDSIWILVNGKVSLYRTLNGEKVVFHSQTVGRIIGLLAFSSRNRSFFACRAVTPVTLMKISFADLTRALEADAALLGLFSMVLLRSMARRNRRLVELQTEVLTLNQKLAEERDQVARTLRELQQAQALLVESEKMATLGQMAAGVAHELNNPIAAIARAADFLGRDLMELAGERPDGRVLQEQITRAIEQRPVSTRVQREQREILARLLRDEDRAARLVEIGIETPDEFSRLAAALGKSPDEALPVLERYHQLGASLRNIDRCARRITELVQSLRSYARADEPEPKEADIHEGIEDTLRLLAHRLREIELDRQYGALPPLQSRGGELNQVWTNLIVNALDAMQGRGRLCIRTEIVGAGQIAVHIVDNGPGIPPDHLNRIFDLRFTTRQGRVEFGLGLGLSICRNIITRLGGTISVTSRPGCTDFCVTLPVAPKVGTEAKEQNPS
ncbi:MAG TPA: ATP-binding protein [Kiritimatiellia bacterium]|nr:ATP-binding protein [Kiritimatiellia bacterium]